VLRLFNTLTRRVEPFVPLIEGEVRMYTCGPTVYRPVHLGNLRSYLLADWLRRTFEFDGRRVIQVKNITDVGHMRQDAVDRGEDKVIAAALAAGKTPMEIAATYERQFLKDESDLGILPATVYPRATEHVPSRVLVHTGDGKGKSTAAFGMVARALGWNQKVGIVQYIKGKWITGERQFFKRFPDQVRYEIMGQGFTWDTQDRARDIAAAEAAWAISLEMLHDPKLDLVLFDELNIALRYDYLDIAQVVADLSARPRDKHVVITGRNAKPELIEAADLVTEMTLVKHHFAAGVKAQAGIEY